ncbi:MAG: bifunctional heptose 7-phosphate kinase/heptose 1-phosphate adenyltransferase, partial [Rhodospirillales bacterium]|nr:bifunctional heptose 7-phosphate kinase/heptose 1-phosphate adenyltransferase [Rhodospirillales bacterium]
MSEPAADHALAAIVRHFPAARVVVLGDIILDRYVAGQAARLSPEAPIPVLRPTRRHATLGGAANVALNIATLGGRAVLIGLAGQDAAGEELRALLAAQPAIEDQVLAVPGRPTTAKTRFLAGAHQILRLDEETTEAAHGALAEALLARFIAALDAAAPEGRVVVLSDYAKGVLSDAVLGPALAAAAARGVTVIADPKRADFTAYAGATILTPNEAETRLATRIDAAEDADAERAGAAALAATGGQAVLVTRSAKGLTLVRRDLAPLHLPTRARAVADVSGAGDTLVAALAVALGAGAALPDAAALANATAGLSVAKPGTATVSAEEVLATLHLRELVATDAKIAGDDAALAQVAAWRAAGLKVGFANGCFDLIHPGHIRLLSEARAACDRLVVALNTDASVRRLKGPSRPVQNETARATVMASLSPVDLVTLFDDDTPLRLIGLLRPDVLVKGA